MELHIGVSKVKKYATSESGDTLEFIERPGGGLSVVLADGQRSGKSAKSISNKVVRKVVSLLAEGVRDGAAARASSDYLYHERRGKVTATLNIISVDLYTNTLVVTRNNPAPVFIYKENHIETMDEISPPVGTRRNTRPVIREFPLNLGLTVLVFTDGIINAGEKFGKTYNIREKFHEIVQKKDMSAQTIADFLLNEALTLDQGRPSDDISVVVLQVLEREGDHVRRVNVRIPFSP